MRGRQRGWEWLRPAVPPARRQHRLPGERRNSGIGYAPGQAAEFHRLEERDEPPVIRLVHRELRERHFERDAGIERDELLGDARLLGEVDQ